MQIKEIIPPDKRSGERAGERWNSIAKPLGSLGLLEDAIVKLAQIQRTENVKLGRRLCIVMCADNGVVCEGVTQSDSSVTALCADEIATGRSNVNVIADTVNAKVIAVDIGVAVRTEALDRKIAEGTANMAAGAAMTREEAEKAIQTGIDLVRKAKSDGVDIIVVGEMGIGNTTTSAAVTSVFLGIPPSGTAGRGAGLDDKRLAHKIDVIAQAIAVNRPDPRDALDVLSKVGGLDIAGMAGLYIGCAQYGTAAVIDGAVSASAALAAQRLVPGCESYMLAGHVSAEPVGKLILDELGLEAPIHAGLRLGEGTGGLMLLPLLDCALSVYERAHRFDEINLERYKPL